jgi:hypothetical protein
MLTIPGVVVGRSSLRRGIRNHDIVGFVRQRGIERADRGGASSDAVRFPAGEWIVVTSIENSHLQFSSLKHRVDRTVHRNCAVLWMTVVHQAGIDRNEVIRAAHLDTMTSIIYDGNICRVNVVFEFLQRVLKLHVPQVSIELNLVTRPNEHFCDRFCVVAGILEPSRMLVVGIANDEGDACVLGLCWKNNQ